MTPCLSCMLLQTNSLPVDWIKWRREEKVNHCQESFVFLWFDTCLCLIDWFTFFLDCEREREGSLSHREAQCLPKRWPKWVWIRGCPQHQRQPLHHVWPIHGLQKLICASTFFCVHAICQNLQWLNVCPGKTQDSTWGAVVFIICCGKRVWGPHCHWALWQLKTLKCGSSQPHH